MRGYGWDIIGLLVHYSYIRYATYTIAVGIQNVMEPHWKDPTLASMCFWTLPMFDFALEPIVRFHAYSAYMSCHPALLLFLVVNVRILMDKSESPCCFRTLVQLCVGVSETLSQKPRVTCWSQQHSLGAHPKLHVELEKLILIWKVPMLLIVKSSQKGPITAGLEVDEKFQAPRFRSGRERTASCSYRLGCHLWGEDPQAAYGGEENGPKNTDKTEKKQSGVGGNCRDFSHEFIFFFRFFFRLWCGYSTHLFLWFFSSLIWYHRCIGTPNGLPTERCSTNTSTISLWKSQRLILKVHGKVAGLGKLGFRDMRAFHMIPFRGWWSHDGRTVGWSLCSAKLQADFFVWAAIFKCGLWDGVLGDFPKPTFSTLDVLEVESLKNIEKIICPKLPFCFLKLQDNFLKELRFFSIPAS